MDIKEHYITKDSARMLKKIGFPQDWHKTCHALNLIYEDHDLPFGMGYTYSDQYAMVPLHIVQRWLDEEKNIFIEVIKLDQTYYCYRIVQEAYDSFEEERYLDRYTSELDKYKTSEDALSAGIEKVLTILIKK